MKAREGEKLERGAMPFDKNVKFIMERLQKNGFRCDIVGGAVRDFLLGREGNDYDITTSAEPDETKATFSDFRTVDIGIKHGTVAVVIDKKTYEITTYRVDGEYLDSRHPENVTFTKNLKEDCARRDFTVNAICYNDKDGFTDYYGGIKDLENKLIRAVGEPEKRFTEDALRILRGIRFSSVLNFKIEEETEKALHKTARLLREVSAERIYAEWKKLLSGENAYSVIKNFGDIISVFLPRIKTYNLPRKDLFQRADYMARELSLFYLNSQSPSEDYNASMTDLKTDKYSRKIGTEALEQISKRHLKDKTDFLLMLGEVGERVAKLTVKLGLLLEKYDKEQQDYLDELIKAETPYKISDLKITGDDLKRQNIKGKAIGYCLNNLLLSVIKDEIPNEKDALIKAAKEFSTAHTKGQKDGI